MIKDTQRRIDEYSAGHIAESINIPVEEIETTPKKIIDKNRKNKQKDKTAADAPDTTEEECDK